MAQMKEGELDQVSELLMGMSRADLHALQQRIENKSQFIDHLSGSLGEAIFKAAETDSFKSSMAPVVASGVLKTARSEPVEMGKAIAPALGPAIRGMVTLALENMNQRIDAHIQTNFSIQGFKWRLESRRTGVPLVDIVMRETLDFRVEHLMLIHQNTGTLLQEISQPDISTKDPAVVSSMLTAVSDFVVDAFGADGSTDEAQTYKVGDLTAYVERLGDLALAAVVRGTVSSGLKSMLREKLETICVICGEAAHNFDGDVEPFALAESMLKDCLISRSKKQDKVDQEESKQDANAPEKKSKGRVIIGLLLLTFFAMIGWMTYQNRLDGAENANSARFEHALRASPGATLIDFDTNPDSEARFSVSLLLDPLAPDPKTLAVQFGYSSSSINWIIHPYVSLDSSLIDLRIDEFLQPPDSVSYQNDAGVLTFAGSASHSWLDRARSRAPFIPGLTSVDLSALIDSSLLRRTELLGEIEGEPIYFEYATASLSPEGVVAAANLKARIDELRDIALEVGQALRLYANIDPLSWSFPREEDYDRADRRIETLSVVFDYPVSLRQVEVVNSGSVNQLPYATISVEFLE